jgi:hypothetical protein
MGLGCPVHSNPLHARPDQYPRPTLTEEQMQLFRGGEVFTPMVNAALQADGDPSLQAEVFRYRATLRRANAAAAEVVQARQSYHRLR